MNEHETLILQGRRLLARGRRVEARRVFQQAAALAPRNEEAWLLLAAVSSPRASLAYLVRALEINPRSEPAHKGIAWARKRVTPANVLSASRLQSPPITSPAARVHASRPLGLWMMASGVALITTLVVIVGGTPSVRRAAAQIAFANVAKATFTPTSTFTPTNTPTPTPTFTPTFTPTPTPTDTATPTPLPTDTPWPTWTPVPPTPIPPPPPTDAPPPPVAGTGGAHWIDVNLSAQSVTAYEGQTPVATFIVSTGTWEHPTVTGQYYIYVKYVAADMAGPGYYLPAVPYVMYFYQGYGIHGTYWHHNFGTPMSHGCVNLTIPDSEWMFNFASVGTLVNIHY